MHHQAKITWFKIATHENEIAFNENNMAVVEVNHKKLHSLKKQGMLYAFAYKCPHAGGILAEGFLDAMNNIVCPLHRYKYNIASGHNTSGEGYFLKNLSGGKKK